MTFLASLTRRGSVALVATALGMALLPSSAFSTAAAPMATTISTYTPVTGAIFNRPVGGYYQQRAIFTHVNRTISATPPGATIKIAVFSFSEKATADRLIAAQKRGVNVQLIFDNHIVYTQEARLRKAFGTNTNARSFVKLCSQSCRGTSGNMHDKFFLFSQSGRAQNVVMTGSNNMTRHNAIDQWSDVYTVVGDPALYYVFSGVFDAMKLDRAQTSPYIGADINGYQAQFYPFPGTTQSTDPIDQVLSEVVCEVPDANNTDEVPTELRISQHAWNGSRGVYLANKVATLAKGGCKVSVIYGVGMGSTVRNILVRAKVAMSAGTHKGIRTHEKYLLLKGGYGDNPAAQIVWTGSHNWSNGALRRDEVVFKVEGEAPYAQYLANFNDIWANG